MPVPVAGGGSVPEAGSGEFRRVPVFAGVGSGGRFPQKVPESSGVCWCSSGRFRRVPESSSVSEGSGEFRCGLLPCKLDRSNHVIVFERLLVMTLSTWAKPLRNKNVPI